MPSLLPIGGAIRLNPSAGGAATVVPLADGGFAAVYRVADGPDVFTLYDDDFNPIGGETDVTSDDFLAPQAAALDNGQFVVAWLAQDQTIQAQIYNPDGSLATGPVTLAVPTDPSVGLSAPKIVGNAFGGFTAVWQDNATIDGVAGSVFIQSYDASGNPVGDPITVEPPPSDDPLNVAVITDFRIAVLADGTIVVAAAVQINGVDSIMYSVNGGPLTTLAGGDDANFVYINPQITPLASGGYVITYDFVNPTLVTSDSPDANWTTGGAVFTTAGNQHDFAIGTTVTTTASGTFAVDPSVVTPLADGGFVVTFEPLTSPLGDGYLVDAQQFDSFGNAVGPVVLVTPQGFLPSVATSANGVILDTYQFGAGIFLQGYSAAPTPLGAEPLGTSFGLNSVVSANSPGVAPLTDAGFVVTYQDADGNSWAQIYDYNRQALGPAFEIAPGGVQPVVASQSNGTFMVAWSTGTQIMGAIYDNQGDLLTGPFDMSGPPSSLPLLDPAINATTSGGYSLAYQTDLQDGSGSHLVTVQVFDGSGNAIGSSVSQTYAPTNPLAPPKIAALEAQLFGSVTVIGVGDSIVAAIVSDPPSGNSSAGVAGEAVSVTHDSLAPTPITVQVSGSDDATRAGSEVTTIDDGNIVIVWSEAPANSGTWNIVGQILTPTGAFVGGQFTIDTALPSNAQAAQIALSALPDGGFLVTYDSGNTTLASQRFDATGTAVGAPVLMMQAGQGQVVTTVLSNGTLLLASDNAGEGGGSITGAMFSLAAIPINWTGSVNTDLGTAGNWDLDAVPDTGHLMQFSLANGGTLTGTAGAESAGFFGTAPWILSTATVTLVQGLTEQTALQIEGGSLTGGGTASIGAADGASVSASGGAQVSFANTAIGTGSGQSGTLTVSGNGTGWTDTGTAGAGGLQVGGGADSPPGLGLVTVTQGATLSGKDVDVLGLTAGSEGGLLVTGGGHVSDAGLVIGQSGTGVASLNSGILTNTGSLELGQVAGGQGTLTVTGTSAAATVSGPVTVGDAGVGSLTIQSGGTVDGLAGLVIANTESASGSGVSVSGTGSRLEVGGALSIGAAGSGALAISAGGQVTAAALDAGSGAGGSGVISVTGTNTALSVSGTANVGDQSAATLSILNGATFNAGFLTIGMTGNAGAVILGSAASTLNVSNDVTVGHDGVLSVGAGETIHIAGNLEVDGALVQGDDSTIDPTVTTNNARTGEGGGGELIATTQINNDNTYYVGEDHNGTYTFQTPLITALAGKAGVLELGPVNSPGAEGDMVLNVGTVDGTQKVQFTGTAAVLTLGQFDSAPLVEHFGATINGFEAGDTIVVDTAAATSFSLNGSVVSLVNTIGGAVEGTIAFADAASAGAAIETSGALVDQVACFAAGTRIATTRGAVPVDSIRPGDRVCTVLGGDTAEVIWTGHRKIECVRHAEPSKVWPVVISAHAFGRGMPATDLTLSPDHAVYVDEVLIPVRLLVNGTTVRQMLVERITYHHIELARHDVLLANGMPAESYLDTGDRSRFSNGGEVIALHPDFSARTWEMSGCAPLMLTGPVVSSVRRRLAAVRRQVVGVRSGGPGKRRANNPTLDP